MCINSYWTLYMEQSVNFCSECKYAKEIEFNDGIKIKCMRVKSPENVRQVQWGLTFAVFKKFNATACAYFEGKTGVKGGSLPSST